MLHAGLDLSRTRLDVCLLDELGERVWVGAVPPDADGLAGFVRRVGVRHGPMAVRAAIESMNGARFVHDSLERLGWEVEIADAAKVKGLAPLACKTDRIDAWVLAELSRRELVPSIWLPEFGLRQLTHAGPRYLRWALMEAATHACRHELYRERYQQTKRRLGKQRGPKVAQIDLARQLAEAIWHMLTRDQPFAPAGATPPLAA